MRSTITLDDDVARTVKNEMKCGKTFKEAVNDLIRRGRYSPVQAAGKPKARPFKVKAFDLGSFPDIDYGKTSELLALLDVEDHK